MSCPPSSRSNLLYYMGEVGLICALIIFFQEASVDGIENLPPTDIICDLVQTHKLRHLRQGHPF